MPILTGILELARCPHCGVNTPLLRGRGQFVTVSHDNQIRRFWNNYECAKCGGVVLASALQDAGVIYEMFPEVRQVNSVIPEPARSYLSQALETISAPAGAVMLCASAVDAMLKAKSYRDGTLYLRINQAADDHLITSEMAQWAHEVRLDANDQRHADDSASLPTLDDAKRCVDFALALGEFLFVLPSRVNRGLADATQQSATS
jgi:hypothetical protein